MDLLRLVLARQDLEALFRLPKLLQSKRFLETRQRTVNVRSPKKDYVEQCTMEGELCKYSIFVAHLTDLRNRAVFLRDSRYYKFFGTAGEEDLDVWYALESGIPEIQACAIYYLDRTNLAQYELSKFNDLWSIPWTTELKKEIFRIIEKDQKLTDYPEKISFLLGYLGYRGKRLEGLVQKEYRLGQQERILDANFSNGRILEMISGDNKELLYPAIHRSILKADLVVEFLNEYPREFNQVLEGISLADVKRTRSVTVRVRRYLGDPAFLAAFSGTSLFKVYSILSGTPRKSASLAEVDFGVEYHSVQQLVVYNPAPISSGLVGGRIAFLLGRVDEFLVSYGKQRSNMTLEIRDRRNWWQTKNQELIDFLHFVHHSGAVPSPVAESEEGIREILKRLTSAL